MVPAVGTWRDAKRDEVAERQTRTNQITQRHDLEISRSLHFLSSIGAATDRWIMSYPYGDWNAELLELLAGAGCVAAFTTEVVLANLKSDPLLLSRIDTNDLPKTATAQACQWRHPPTARSKTSAL